MITTLEVLSPANKAPGTQGRTQFLHKRQAVMASHTHWIEIDLLRGGERPVELRGRGDYYALLRREGARVYEVWVASLRDRLPIITVPVRAPTPDVPLDLQTLVETVYRRGYYADSIDYGKPVPPPPLSPADAEWVQQQVRSWSERRATRA